MLTTSIIINNATRAGPADFSPANYSKYAYREYLGRGNRKVILHVLFWKFVTGIPLLLEFTWDTKRLIVIPFKMYNAY